ncbi:Obg-like ATPase 1 [Vanrija pseudolonga]|uniref:Obg-like ATPase 1 n=1 Tax=Vanrija pseudolonga TaxID=143232 RepID=A0AAF0Y5I3_9TREE|nr:Obg-like ATPase 1 [Vanrija pseudolonga]
MPVLFSFRLTLPVVSLVSLFHSSARSEAKKKMPPKKKVVEEKKVILGRPGNNLKIGIVGVPNVGKSSFFNTLSKTDLGKAANFPYATIDPEEARIPVPDERFDWLVEVYKPQNKIPAFLTCIDIAGLTAGASTGAGLGNAFLSHVRAVDGIFQMVRAFDDAEVIHVDGDVDPVRDMQTISTELRLKDIEWVEKAIEVLKKAVRSTGSVSLADKAKREELATVERIHAHLLADKDVRKGQWTNKEVEIINGLTLLTAKPITYLVNLSERDFVRRKNKYLPKIKAWIDENNPGDQLIPFSVSLEERLVALSEEEAAEEGDKLGLGKKNPSQLGKITTAGYASLDLIRYFTCGPQEVRAWTVRNGIKAPAAAGVIHSDFENKFVCGEIMSYKDLKEHGSEAAVKADGKLRQQGKTYEIVDGDICYWKAGHTPASFADIPPVLRWEDDAEVVVESGSWTWGGSEGAGAGANGSGAAPRVKGRLYVTEAAVSFLPANGGTGFTLPFPALTLHALTPASESTPAHLYCQIDEGQVDESEEEYAPLSEMRVFVPSEKLEGLFSALSACSALHDSVLPNGEPSSFFGFGDDDDDDEEDDDGAFDDAEDGEDGAGGRDGADADADAPASPDPIEAFLSKVDWGNVAPPGEWVDVGVVESSGGGAGCASCDAKDAEIARLRAELTAERAAVARLQRRLVGLGGLEDKLAAAEIV